MCGRKLDPVAPKFTARPRSVPACGKCGALVAVARRQDERATGVTARRNKAGKGKSRKAELSLKQQIARQRRASRAARRAEEADRLDRQRGQGSSIRTVSGGLPTLGRHHR